jgi:hypothetical protein
MVNKYLKAAATGTFKSEKVYMKFTSETSMLIKNSIRIRMKVVLQYIPLKNLHTRLKCTYSNTAVHTTTRIQLLLLDLRNCLCSYCFNLLSFITPKVIQSNEDSHVKIA